ncbi:hypothetical protein DFH94DRAFT_739716 [Russula ochroleuca]|uniref:Uncharacterized protein n=1 Tax=Russula ochroleuca TaxID=152965 RepID=A0A9P5T8L5_9AGAM|nr:hypothetical protein DFH94DRAFT_739716 [Russula ochroleuca]
MNQGSITVHAFSRPSEYDLDVAREDAILLSRGRSVTHAGCRTFGWRTPDARDSKECFLNNAFIYLPAPPLVPAAAALTTCTMEEWDTRPLESENFSTADLEPFGSSPLAVPKEGRNRPWSGSSSPRRPPTKRKKVEEDMGPLDELIPLPHYIPAPLKPWHPALPHVLLDVSTFFVPVPPQTKSSIEALFSSIYSRVAWLIPVRGLPPWEGVSRGRVALGDISLSSLGHGHLSTSSDSDIVWTYSSFRQFWTFLRSSLETAGSVTGPLSLSFCAAPRSDPTGMPRGSEPSATSVYLPANRETEIMPSDPSPLVPIARASKSRLADIDYVKVYCDAPRTMLVRRTLGEWEYKEGGHVEAPGNLVEAIRILEFAKLVLVNERGEGLLIS